MREVEEIYEGIKTVLSELPMEELQALRKSADHIDNFLVVQCKAASEDVINILGVIDKVIGNRIQGLRG